MVRVLIRSLLVDSRLTDTALEMVLGEPVSAISFVMDYVEVHFNGPVVRCIANPTVSHGEGEFLFPEVGSRDQLFRLIDRQLDRVECVPGVTLRLRFSGGPP